MKLLNISIIIGCLFISHFLFGQVGIGTTSPNNNAVLDVTNTNKGVLLTRVPLSNTSLASPLLSHTAGMTVYNTATTGDVTPGIYYNDGTKWVRTPSPTFREHFIQNNGLSITSNTTYFAVPGLDGVTITVPESGYYQFNFTGYYAAPRAEGGFFAGTYFCNGEGYFRIRVSGNTKKAYAYATSFAEETPFDSNHYFEQPSNTKTNFQVYLTAGTHTINVDFYQYYLGNNCLGGANATVGGIYSGADDARLSIFYAGQ